MEPISLASLNVRCLGRGLAGVRKRRKMKELFARVTPRPDILFLQEHKYSLEECQIRAQKVDFLRYTSRWSDTSYSAARDSFTGGIGMLLSKKLAEQICEHGVIDSGRAQYVTLQLSHNLKLGIINVYGYNDTGSRASLWKRMRRHPLPQHTT